MLEFIGSALDLGLDPNIASQLDAFITHFLDGHTAGFCTARWTCSFSTS